MRQLASLAETDREHGALGSGAPPALVPGPVNERFERDATAYKQRADTLGRVKLVSGDREQIDAEPIHVSRNLADRLSRVGVEKDTMFAGDARALLNRLDGAHLVVGVHGADEDRARRDGPAQVIGIDTPESIHGQVSYPRALAFKKPTRFNDCWMFYPRGDDVIANIAPCKVDTFERKIVGLAAAAGEDDFIVLAAEQRRNLPACFFKGGLGRRGSPMPARRVAEVICKKG